MADGVDTLVFSVRGDVPDDLVDLLADIRSSALAAAVHAGLAVVPASTPFSFAGSPLVLLAYGRKSWRYVLHNDLVDIQLVRGGAARVGASVRLSALYLWSVGAAVAAVMAQGWAVDVLGVAPDAVIVSEVHLCRDVAGWDVAQEWRSLEPCKVAKADTLMAVEKHRRYETVAIGVRSGPVSAVLYDKVAELRVHHKEWMRDVWARRGWQEGTPVTRVEFRVRRDFLRSIKVNTVEDLIDSSALASIWQYCTHDWLRFCDRSVAGRHADRAPVLAVWLMVAASFDDEQDCMPVVRATIVNAQVGPLLAQSVGCLVSVAALLGSSSFDVLGSLLGQSIEDKEARSGLTFEDMAKRRGLLYAGGA